MWVWAASDSPQSPAVVWLVPPRVVVMLRKISEISPSSIPRYLKRVGRSGGAARLADVARAKETRSCSEHRPRAGSRRPRLIAALPTQGQIARLPEQIVRPASHGMRGVYGRGLLVQYGYFDTHLTYTPSGLLRAAAENEEHKAHAHAHAHAHTLTHSQ